MPTKKTESGGVKKLVRYIANIAKQIEFEYQHLSGIGDPDSVDEMIEEMLDVQAMNDRARSDKNLHLILSFHQKDPLTQSLLENIETDVINALDLSGHQYVSVLHSDTDHPHLHLAFNKVHPETYKMARLSHSKRKLMTACEEIELRYGLTVDNHGPALDKEFTLPNGADSVERQQGEQSIVRQLNHDFKTHEIASVNNWEAFHAKLQAIGVQYEKQAGGGVFKRLTSDSTKPLVIKASRLKGFGLPTLQKKLGAFIAPRITSHLVGDAQSVPVAHIDHTTNNAYFQRYQKERNRINVDKTHALTLYKEQKQQIMEDSKAEYHSIKAQPGPNKRALYSANKIRRVARLELLIQSRAVIPTMPGYADWLAKCAQSGDETALTLLRQRKPTQNRKRSITGATLESTHTVKNKAMRDLAMLTFSINRKGEAVFSTGNTTLRDRGRDILINHTRNDAMNLLYVKFAQQRYGQNLTLHGDDTFKKNIIKTVHEHGLTVNFSDSFSQEHLARLKGDQVQNIIEQQYKGSTNVVNAFIQERAKHGEQYSLFSKAHHSQINNVVGVRKIDDQYIALMQSEKGRIVIPISTTQARQIRRLKKTQVVQLHIGNKGIAIKTQVKKPKLRL